MTDGTWAAERRRKVEAEAEKARQKAEATADQLRHMQESSLKIWDLYVHWYTWFVGVSLLTLGWFVTNLNKVDRELGIATSGFMVLASMLGAAGAMVVHRYDRSARDIAIKLAASPEAAQLSEKVSWMSRLVSWLIAGALGALVVVWVAVAVHLYCDRGNGVGKVAGSATGSALSAAALSR